MSIDKDIVALARRKAKALGKSLNQMIRDYLLSFVDPTTEQSIAEFSRLSGRGNSLGLHFTRDDIHERS